MKAHLQPRVLEDSLLATRSPSTTGFCTGPILRQALGTWGNFLGAPFTCTAFAECLGTSLVLGTPSTELHGLEGSPCLWGACRLMGCDRAVGGGASMFSTAAACQCLLGLHVSGAQSRGAFTSLLVGAAEKSEEPPGLVGAAGT